MALKVPGFLGVVFWLSLTAMRTYAQVPMHPEMGFGPAEDSITGEYEGERYRLEARYLWFADENGLYYRTEHFYLILRYEWDYGHSEPILLDVPLVIGKRMDARDPQFYAVDIDSDGIDEVALQYGLGARHTYLEIFRWADRDLVPMEEAVFASGMRHVRAFDGGCVHSADTLQDKLWSEIYQYHNGRFELVRESSDQILSCPGE